MTQAHFSAARGTAGGPLTLAPNGDILISVDCSTSSHTVPWEKRDVLLCLELDGAAHLVGTVPSITHDATGVYYGLDPIPPDRAPEPPSLKAVRRWDQHGKPLAPLRVALPPRERVGLALDYRVGSDGNLWVRTSYESKYDTRPYTNPRLKGPYFIIKYSPEGKLIAGFAVRPLHREVGWCDFVGADGAFWAWEAQGRGISIIRYAPD